MNTQDIKNVIVTHLAGSHAYGTSTPTSDVDIRGIFLADKEQICTPFFPIREVTMEDQEDGKMFELNNFMKLYCDMNPNIIETLWVDKADVQQSSVAYDMLRRFRADLLSSKVAFTFSGYAISQLKRIKGHDKWLTNPQPVDPPSRSQFIRLVHNYSVMSVNNDNLLAEIKEDHLLLPYGGDIYGVIHANGRSTVNSDGSLKLYDYESVVSNYIGKIPVLIVKVLEDKYQEALRTHKQYWEWKANRNVARHETEIKFGYDTKHAMHLVRLLRMGEEILTTGEVIVKRPDAKELLEIRNGAWQYNDLIKWAEEKDELIRGKLYRETKLPKSSNIKLAAKIILDIQENIWNT